MNTPVELNTGLPWGGRCGRELQQKAQLERQRWSFFC